MMSTKSALVLVTGATGFTASHVIQQLQRAGHRVRGTVRDIKNNTKCQPLRELCPEAAHPLELVQADILQADTWPAAVSGCDYILHLATPRYDETKAVKRDIVQDTVDSVVNVMQAARDAKCVKRVVYTSSFAAIQGGCAGEHGRTYSEDDWTDVNDPTLLPMIKCKVAGEKAAWDFVAQMKEVGKSAFELSVINTGFIMGPLLTSIHSTEFMVINMMLQRKLVLVPHLNAAIVDVRDVAAAHIAAMTSPKAAGKRYIVFGGNRWFTEIAHLLDKEFEPKGHCIPTWKAPNCIMWVMGWFDSTAGMIQKSLDKQCMMNNDRMINELNIKPQDVDKTVLEMAYSLIEQGYVKLTPSKHHVSSAPDTEACQKHDGKE